MNILFTCAGRRNYLINYFKEALRGKGKVISTDMQLSAPAMMDSDLAFTVPSLYSDSYIPSLLEIIKNNDVDAVISLNDLELPILSAHREEIEETGARLLVSDCHVINIASDKIKTVEFLESVGLKTPKTFTDIDEAYNEIENGTLDFPLVIKPRWGSGSIGIFFPEDKEELELPFLLQKKRLKNTVLSQISIADVDRSVLIQEKIKGQEYGMDVLNDFEGNYIGTFVREKLAMRSGETDKAVSVIDERFHEVGRIIGENLRHVGNLDCDVFLTEEGELYVLELNPRFGGGYPFSHEAGVNIPAIYIEWLRGGVDILPYLNYEAGVMFSKYDRLIKVSDQPKSKEEDEDIAVESLCQ